MAKPDFLQLTPVTYQNTHEYEPYLPTAFNESLTLLQKVNKVIHEMNKIGQVTNGFVEMWNELIKWITGEGLEDTIRDQLNEFLENGQLEALLYNILEGIWTHGYDVFYSGITSSESTDYTTKIRELNQSSHDILYFRKGTYKMDVPPTKLVFGHKAKLVINGIPFVLGVTPQQINSMEQVQQRLNNTVIGVNAGLSLNLDPDLSYGNTAVGSQALMKSVNNRRNTAFGTDALKELTDGYSATAIGVGALQESVYNDRGTFVGGNAGKWLGATNLVGRHGLFNELEPTPVQDELWSAWRTYAGTVGNPAFRPISRDDTTSNVGVGRNSLGFALTTKRSVAIGYNAGEQVLNGDGVVAIGECALQYGIKNLFGVYIGQRAGFHMMESEQDVAIGRFALGEHVHAKRNVAIGYQALAGLKMNRTDNPESNVAIGRISMANATGDIYGNVAIGENTLTNVTNRDNVAVGRSAGSNLTGTLNTLIGTNAGNGLTEVNNATALGYNALNSTAFNGYDNITGIGMNASVTGSNQLQLGNSSTTPYAFNAVQLRSDRRDKKDIEDLPLLLDFVRELQPKQYRQDFRESYREWDEESQEMKLVKQDGSRSGSRKHFGFIAQEVEELLNRHNFDFGGFQHHSVKGGQDIYSLGYEEFLPILWKTVQHILERMDNDEV